MKPSVDLGRAHTAVPEKITAVRADVKVSVHVFGLGVPPLYQIKKTMLA